MSSAPENSMSARYIDFASDVATETVCYSSVGNTNVSVIVPEGAPQDHVDDVVHAARGYGLVPTRVHTIDGDAFDFELDFAPVEVVAFGDGDDE